MFGTWIIPIGYVREVVRMHPRDVNCIKHDIKKHGIRLDHPVIMPMYCCGSVDGRWVGDGNHVPCIDGYDP